MIRATIFLAILGWSMAVLCGALFLSDHVGREENQDSYIRLQYRLKEIVENSVLCPPPTVKQLLIVKLVDGRPFCTYYTNLFGYGGALLETGGAISAERSTP